MRRLSLAWMTLVLVAVALALLLSRVLVAQPGSTAIVSGSTLPATCVAGVSYFSKTGTNPGLKWCPSTNTWADVAAEFIPTGGVDELMYYKYSDGTFRPVTLSAALALTTGTLGVKPVAAYTWVAAASQAGTDSLAFNVQSTGAATATHTGTTILVPTASFVNGATTEIQFHFLIPKDWDGAAMSLEGLWRTAATTGSATWSLEGACAGDASVAPTAYSSTPDTSGADAAKGTTLQFNDFTIAMSVAANHTLATCAVKKEFFGRLSLNNTDLSSNAAQVSSFTVYFTRSQ